MQKLKLILTGNFYISEQFRRNYKVDLFELQTRMLADLEIHAL